MRFNKLLLGTALLVPMFMTSCGDPETEPLTISYIGESSYSITSDYDNAIFTLPFKLSRELKNGEKMDEVQFTATQSEHLARGSNFSFSVNGTSLTLSTKVTLNGSSYSGDCAYEFSINALKASGAPLAKLIQPMIPFNLSQKHIYVDYEELDKLLEDNNFELSEPTTELTKDNKTVYVSYKAKTGATATKVDAELGLFKEGEATALQSLGTKTFDPNQTSIKEIELGILTDANWNTLENEDCLYIKKI